jgi:hypothetical protein
MVVGSVWGCVGVCVGLCGSVWVCVGLCGSLGFVGLGFVDVKSLRRVG